MPVLSPDERKSMTLEPSSISELAQSVVNGKKLTFQSLKNRDAVARELKGYKLHKYTAKNQLYDPRYTVEGSDIPDANFAR